MTKSVVHLQQNLNLKLRVWSLSKVILYLKPELIVWNEKKPY